MAPPVFMTSSEYLILRVKNRSYLDQVFIVGDLFSDLYTSEQVLFAVYGSKKIVREWVTNGSLFFGVRVKNSCVPVDDPFVYGSVTVIVTGHKRVTTSGTQTGHKRGLGR